MRIRRNLLVWSTVAALVVAIVGGWLFSSASDDGVDANLTNPGVVQDPTIGTNAVTNGEALPAINLPSVTTGDLTAIFPQGRPLVINFWFSTCEPCRHEMPVLQNAHLEWGDRVEFIGVNPQDNPADAEKFAAKYGIDYPLLLDRDGALVGKVGVSTFPTTLFVDTNGQVVLQYAGELTEDELAASIKEAFNFQ